MDLRITRAPYSVARLTAWVPWLCVPDSHRVCPYRPAKPLAGSASLRSGLVRITRSADPGPVNRLFRLGRAMCYSRLTVSGHWVLRSRTGWVFHMLVGASTWARAPVILALATLIVIFVVYLTLTPTPGDVPSERVAEKSGSSCGATGMPKCSDGISVRGHGSRIVECSVRWLPAVCGSSC